jgi:dihydrofolate synthase/folylpolyglutamate synthase
MCEALAREHGLSTGLYSSPHLDSVFERIRLNGVPITPRHALRLLDRAEAALTPACTRPGST